MSKFLVYNALATKVLAVASVNEDVGDWAVYIDAVPGKCHDDEMEEVRREGAKTSKDMAELLFGRFKHLRYRL